jgi:hypothetical protein
VYHGFVILVADVPPRGVPDVLGVFWRLEGSGEVVADGSNFPSSFAFLLWVVEECPGCEDVAV